MNDVSRIIAGTSDEFTLSIATNHIMFKFDETVITSRLIDGEFYDINSMISNDFAIKVTADRSALIECVERAGLFVKEGDKKPIIFTINSNDSMEISIQSPTGSMAETLDIDKAGADLCIGFNPRFMAEALKAIADDEVTLNMNGPKAPCFIKDESDSYLYLILPVNFVN
jgi:DNA polymerase-3 subunit beta